MNTAQKKNYLTRKVYRANNTCCIDLGEEGILINHDKYEDKYIANTTTMAIWDLIDGENTVNDIVNTIANTCGVTPSAIEEDIVSTIRIMEEKHLVRIEKNGRDYLQ